MIGIIINLVKYNIYIYIYIYVSITNFMEGLVEDTNNNIDNVNISKQSLDFIDLIGRAIYNVNRDYVYTEHFYKEWIEKMCETEREISVTLESIIGYIYCGLMYTKESMYDFLPNVDLNYEGDIWGIATLSYKIPKCQNPKLRYAIGRIRNSLANRTFRINVPEDIDKEDILTNVKITFYDQDTNDEKDTFEMELCIGELANFVRSFTSEIYKNIEKNNKQ